MGLVLDAGELRAAIACFPTGVPPVAPNALKLSKPVASKFSKPVASKFSKPVASKLRAAPVGFLVALFRRPPGGVRGKSLFPFGNMYNRIELDEASSESLSDGGQSIRLSKCSP